MEQKQIKSPRLQQFEVSKQIRKLTTKSKQFYSLLNIFQLQMSRLMKLPTFIQCKEQLQMFNQQLKQYKKDNHQIKNIDMTYYLYQNLFSRLRFVSNLSRNSEQASIAIRQIINWFYTQKPKLRCQIEQTKVLMKESISDPKQNQNIYDLLQQYKVKRQMKAYESMSRTVHNQFFPSKPKLKQYKRKQLIPIQQEEQRENVLTGKKSSSTSALNKMKLTKFRQSMSTMIQTKSSFKSSTRQIENAFQQIKVSNFRTDQAQLQANIQFAQKLAQQRQKQQQQLRKQKQLRQQNKYIDQQLQVIQRQKKVVQLQILQSNIIQDYGQQDQPDQKWLFDDDENPKNQKLRIYAKNIHKEQSLLKIQQQNKQKQQSSLRRIIGTNEQQMRSKMQNLNIKKNMMTWGKLKGKFYKQKTKAAQTFKYLNKYKNLQFIPLAKQQILKQHFQNNSKFSSTTGFNLKEKKKPLQVNLQYRSSKPSNSQSIQKQIQNIKLKDTLSSYKKYIDGHMNIQPIQQTEKQQKQIHQNHFSLTSIMKPQKRRTFSKLMHTHRPQAYNQQAQSDIINIKTSLSGKSLPIEKVNVFKALSVVPIQEVKQTTGVYTVGKQLPSNPFFPKNLYRTKSSKKKKKKK